MRTFAKPAIDMVDTMRTAAAADPARAIAFGGAPGSNSHQAAMQFDPECLPLPFLGFEDALDARGLARAAACVEETISERARVRAALAEHDRVRRTWPSAANFLLAEVADAAGLVAHCGANKILIRHFGGELEDCVRISIGSREDNDRLLDVLAALEANDG